MPVIKVSNTVIHETHGPRVSNAKAKSDLGRLPTLASRRQGFASPLRR
jgi:hypothetical protein